MMVSTLVHEYQHMINFHVKTMRLGKPYSTWYDEMLSMLAEDMIGPLVGIPITDASHPAKDRTRFLLDGYYRAGPTEWNKGPNVLLSYATAYGFGAYLARNFGGVALVKEMSNNNFVNEESVSAALALCPANTSGVTNFLQAISRYGEAFIYNNTALQGGGNMLSYNKTASGTVGGNTYTFHGFDIFSMKGFDLSKSVLAMKGTDGPTVLPASASRDMPPNSVLIFQDDSWKNLSGPLELTLTKPANSNVDFYLMEK
jgi:hypothetical protein